MGSKNRQVKKGSGRGQREAGHQISGTPIRLPMGTEVVFRHQNLERRMRLLGHADGIAPDSKTVHLAEPAEALHTESSIPEIVRIPKNSKLALVGSVSELPESILMHNGVRMRFPRMPGVRQDGVFISAGHASEGRENAGPVTAININTGKEVVFSKGIQRPMKEIAVEHLQAPEIPWPKDLTGEERAIIGKRLREISEADRARSDAYEFPGNDYALMVESHHRMLRSLGEKSYATDDKIAENRRAVIAPAEKVEMEAKEYAAKHKISMDKARRFVGGLMTPEDANEQSALRERQDKLRVIDEIRTLRQHTQQIKEALSDLTPKQREDVISAIDNEARRLVEQYKDKAPETGRAMLLALHETASALGHKPIEPDDEIFMRANLMKAGRSFESVRELINRTKGTWAAPWLRVVSEKAKELDEKPFKGHDWPKLDDHQKTLLLPHLTDISVKTLMARANKGPGRATQEDFLLNSLIASKMAQELGIPESHVPITASYRGRYLRDIQTLRGNTPVPFLEGDAKFRRRYEELAKQLRPVADKIASGHEDLPTGMPKLSEHQFDLLGKELAKFVEGTRGEITETVDYMEKTPEPSLTPRFMEAVGKVVAHNNRMLALEKLYRAAGKQVIASDGKPMDAHVFSGPNSLMSMTGFNQMSGRRTREQVEREVQAEVEKMKSGWFGEALEKASAAPEEAPRRILALPHLPSIPRILTRRQADANARLEAAAAGSRGKEAILLPGEVFKPLPQPELLSSPEAPAKEVIRPAAKAPERQLAPGEIPEWARPKEAAAQLPVYVSADEMGLRFLEAGLPDKVSNYLLENERAMRILNRVLENYGHSPQALSHISPEKLNALVGMNVVDMPKFVKANLGGAPPARPKKITSYMPQAPVAGPASAPAKPVVINEPVTEAEPETAAGGKRNKRKGRGDSLQLSRKERIREARGLR